MDKGFLYFVRAILLLKMVLDDQEPRYLGYCNFCNQNTRDEGHKDSCLYVQIEKFIADFENA